MPNAKNAERRQTGILSVGTTGGGKTTMFSTIPGRKFLYIFDPNAVNTIRGLDIDYEVFLPDHIPFAAVPLASKKQEKVVKRPEFLPNISSSTLFIVIPSKDGERCLQLHLLGARRVLVLQLSCLPADEYLQLWFRTYLLYSLSY